MFAKHRSSNSYKREQRDDDKWFSITFIMQEAEVIELKLLLFEKDIK